MGGGRGQVKQTQGFHSGGPLFMSSVKPGVDSEFTSLTVASSSQSHRKQVRALLRTLAEGSGLI